MNIPEIEALRAQVRKQLIASGKNPDAILFAAKSRRHIPSTVDGMLLKGVDGLPKVVRYVDEHGGYPIPQAPLTGDDVTDKASGAKPASQADRLLAQSELRRRHMRNS